MSTTGKNLAWSARIACRLDDSERAGFRATAKTQHPFIMGDEIGWMQPSSITAG